MRRFVLMAVPFLLALIAAAHAYGLRYNASPSAPIGWWRMTDLPPGGPKVGDFVFACIPLEQLPADIKERGYLGRGDCPGGLGTVLKRVAAVAGDEVVFKEHGVFVNGRRLPRSARRWVDGDGRRLPAPLGERVVLIAGQVLLMSAGCAEGFDGRYWGPAPKASILGQADTL